ncbi:MAG: RidA family protein [Thaumarchaeota archaeon]|nr:RidA family protein [Nitrososphaerota archaeon]
MQSIKSEDAPKAIGPYSQAVAYKDLLFLSGQIALNPKSGEIESTTIEGQTRQVMNNILAVLASTGSDFSRVLKCTVYLSDMQDYPTFNTVYAEFFGDIPPARSTVQVSRLPRDAKLELDVIAYRVR